MDKETRDFTRKVIIASLIIGIAYLMVSHFSLIMGFIRSLISAFSPLLLGIVIAFILNAPLSRLEAFIKNKVSEAMFAATTGYGHSDWGRETLERVFADALDAEDALVRHNFTCGTHTLAVALFGVLRPGDTMLCVSGTPYDTIQPVIGITEEAPDAGSRSRTPDTVLRRRSYVN